MSPGRTTDVGHASPSAARHWPLLTVDLCAVDEFDINACVTRIATNPGSRCHGHVILPGQHTILCGAPFSDAPAPLGHWDRRSRRLLLGRSRCEAPKRYLTSSAPRTKKSTISQSKSGVKATHCPSPVTKVTTAPAQKPTNIGNHEDGSLKTTVLVSSE